MWFGIKFRRPEEYIERWEPRGEEIKTYTASTHGRNMRVSDLEEAACLSDNDYLLMVDTSEKKSVKVKLGALKEYIRRN